MLAKEYFEKITALLAEVEAEQMDKINEAAGLIARSLEDDSLLHLFGGGHSHILAEEVFFRAGGFAPINPILDSMTMLHEGATKASSLEKMHGIGAKILDNYVLNEGEVIIIVSNSGINPLPIDVAVAAKEKGLKVITISAHAYLEEESRHESGKHLADYADVAIDNMLPIGDALVFNQSIQTMMGPGSTVIGTFIINALILAVSEALHANGYAVPVFRSSNDAGGSEHNAEFVEHYRPRVKHL